MRGPGTTGAIKAELDGDTVGSLVKDAEVGLSTKRICPPPHPQHAWFAVAPKFR